MNLKAISTILMLVGAALFVAGTLLAFLGSSTLSSASYWMMTVGWSIAVVGVGIHAYRFFKALKEGPKNSK